jgi:hypothetical protein
MKAKKIYEATGFHRSTDAKASIGVGKAVKAKELLEVLYGRGTYLTYNIKSLDHIEIITPEKIVRRAEGAKNTSGIYDKWIIAYVERDRFTVEEEWSEISSFTHSFGSKKYWNIYEWKFNMSDMPTRMEFTRNVIIDLPNNPEAEVRSGLILKALNDHYGPVAGFEMKEYIKG